MALVLFDFAVVSIALVWLAGLVLFLPAAWAVGRHDPMMWLVTLFWLPVALFSLGYDAIEWLLHRIVRGARGQ